MRSRPPPHPPAPKKLISTLQHSFVIRRPFPLLVLLRKRARCCHPFSSCRCVCGVQQWRPHIPNRVANILPSSSFVFCTLLPRTFGRNLSKATNGVFLGLGSMGRSRPFGCFFLLVVIPRNPRVSLLAWRLSTSKRKQQLFLALHAVILRTISSKPHFSAVWPSQLDCMPQEPSQHQKAKLFLPRLFSPGRRQGRAQFKRLIT